MEEVKVCFYWSYISVTSLIGGLQIISAILLGRFLLAHGCRVGKIEDQIVLSAYYVILIVPLLLAVIGLFGACQKKKWALILFAVGMILASLCIFPIGVYSMARKSELAESLKQKPLNVGPLVATSGSFQDELKEAQTTYQCCGLNQGYLDWGYDIPESCLCLCTDQSTKPCVAAPKDSVLFQNRTSDQPIMIYNEPCLQFLIEEYSYQITVSGVIMASIFLWALSAVLCILILCQMNRREVTSAVV